MLTNVNPGISSKCCPERRLQESVPLAKNSKCERSTVSGRVARAAGERAYDAASAARSVASVASRVGCLAGALGLLTPPRPAGRAYRPVDGYT